MIDYIVVGAGFSGSVIAERIANVLNQRVLLIEKRNHIGGNCYDEYDEYGVLIHKYGPHIFHTDYEDVWEYLSNFCEWNGYKHKVLAFVDKELIPLPFNLNSLEKKFPRHIAQTIKDKLIQIYGYNNKVSIVKLRNSADRDLKILANYIYEKIFFNYTIKQWGIKPEDIDPKVLSRVPIKINYNDYYFDDKYQGLPKKGYANLFKNMLNNPKIELILNKDMKSFIKIDHENKKIFFENKEFKGKLIYTGMIDELFDYKFGKLPYRSLKFVNEHLPVKSYQQSAVVNFPNDYDFTRITEYKKMTLQDIDETTIMKEYPTNYDSNENLPYYPIFTKESLAIYNKYLDYSKNFTNLILVGRLAEFKYYDMDDAIKRALNVFETLRI